MSGDPTWVRSTGDVPRLPAELCEWLRDELEQSLHQDQLNPVNPDEAFSFVLEHYKFIRETLRQPPLSWSSNTRGAL